MICLKMKIAKSEACILKDIYIYSNNNNKNFSKVPISSELRVFFCSFER